MLNENAKKWVEALRSGKYEQGKMALSTEEGKYCCLGVGAALACEAGVIGEEWKGRKYLPAEVKEWLGLRTDSGDMAHLKCLAWLNDIEERNFLRIAEIIESEPEGLFV